MIKRTVTIACTALLALSLCAPCALAKRGDHTHHGTTHHTHHVMQHR